MANVVDPDPFDQSCVVVEPATSRIGKTKTVTGGLFHESISEASGFAVYLGYSPRGSVAGELSSLARLASLAATVTLDGAAVRVENVPANSFAARRLSAAENPRGLDVVRVTLVTQTEGPTPPGKTIHAAVVAHPRGGDLLIRNGGDSDVPAADASKAIDSIVASLVL